MRANSGKTNRSHRISLGIELLESREMPSAEPVLFASVAEGRLDFADSVGASAKRLVQTSPMMETQVQGRLSTGSDVDLIPLQLKKGEILVADLKFAGSSRQVKPQMKLLDGAGNTVVAADNNGIGQRIAVSGTYYVSLTCGRVMGKDPASYSAEYTLKVRPIGLAGNDLDPKWLQTNASGIYVWQVGNMLHVSGPVGHGFRIRGNWEQRTERVRGGYNATYYTYDPVVYVQTSVNNLELPVISDGVRFSVTTKGGSLGKLFGELKSQSFAATTDIIKGIAGGFGDASPFGLNLSAQKDLGVTLGEIGLKLGSDPVLSSKAPLNPVVPYLYINAGAGLTGSFAGLGYSFGSLIVDPSDPFVFFSTDHQNKYGLGVGLSHHGLIPFQPLKAPAAFQGQLFGHVYTSGAFDLFPITGLPLTVSGDIVINLNGRNTGIVNSQTAAAMGSVSQALSGTLGNDGPPTASGSSGSSGGSAGGASSSLEFWRKFSVGINGSLNFSLPVGDAIDAGTAAADAAAGPRLHRSRVDRALDWLPDDVDLSLVAASLIYDGSNPGLYFRGASNSVLHNWLEGSKLEFLAPSSVNLNGAWVQGGRVFLDAQGQFGPIGMPAFGRVTFARNFDLPPELAALVTGQSYAASATVSGAYVEIGINAFGKPLSLKGRISNGDVELIGETGIHLGACSGSLVVSFSNSKTKGVQFAAKLTGNIGIDNVTRASVEVDFRLGYQNGRITYAGSGRARMQVKTPHVSWRGVTWKWEDAGSVNVGVSNESFWFYFAGKKTEISLPR